MSIPPPPYLLPPATSNPWFAVSMGLLGIIVGYGFASLTAQPAVGPSLGDGAPTVVQAPTPTPPSPTPLPSAPQVKNVPPVDLKSDHTRGDPKAKIAVIEYSDFECPFCARHHSTMVQLLKEYEDDVSWVYRHFPLSFHQNAQPAALASECVAEIGGNDAFWQFADLVFEKGFDFTAHVKEIGVSDAKFQACVESGKYKDVVQKQMDGGSQAGVSGTPGNIVLNTQTGDARLVSGAQPLENFKKVIEEMLGKPDTIPPS